LLRKWFYRFLIELTNHRVSSLLLRRFTESKLSAKLISSYSKVYRINHSEIRDDIGSFNTLHDFFIRNIKPETRPIDSTSTSIVSPVDGVVEETGSILPTKEIVVKGKAYSISEMVDNEEILEKYIDGTFMVLYLSPSHYHRIHSPVSGIITHQWTRGRKSYPVNRLGLKYGKAPLSKNYRKLTEILSNGKHLLVVKVGAMFVNSIELTHTDNQVEKGKEMAYFSFGSTVILLFEKNAYRIETRDTPYNIKVGEVVGYLIQEENKKSQQ